MCADAIAYRKLNTGCGSIPEIEARKTYARTTSDSGNRSQDAKMGAPFGLSQAHRSSLMTRSGLSALIFPTSAANPNGQLCIGTSFMRACLSSAGGMCGLVGMKIDSTAGLAAKTRRSSSRGYRRRYGKGCGSNAFEFLKPSLLTEPVEELERASEQAMDRRKIGTGSGIDAHTPLRSSTARDA